MVDSCDICELVVNCGAAISDRTQFQTAVIKLLCQAVDLSAGLIEDINPPEEE